MSHPQRYTQEELEAMLHAQKFTGQQDLAEANKTVERARAFIQSTEKDQEAPPIFEVRLDIVLEEIRTMLLFKNKAYGNSALEPVRIFSKASPSEQIAVRIDDKLSRLKTGHADTEDPKMDIMGYLVLDRIREKFYPNE